MKKTLLLPLIVFSMLFTGAFGADEKKADKKKPAKGIPVLLGITKSSLSTESFISAASSAVGSV